MSFSNYSGFLWGFAFSIVWVLCLVIGLQSSLLPTSRFSLLLIGAWLASSWTTGIFLKVHFAEMERRIERDAGHAVDIRRSTSFRFFGYLSPAVIATLFYRVSEVRTSRQQKICARAQASFAVFIVLSACICISEFLLKK